MAGKPNQPRTRKGRFGNATAWVPSPEEIRAACLEVQDEWTPIERDRRAGILVKDSERPRRGEVSHYRIAEVQVVDG